MTQLLNARDLKRIIQVQPAISLRSGNPQEAGIAQRFHHLMCWEPTCILPLVNEWIDVFVDYAFGRTLQFETFMGPLHSELSFCDLSAR